MATGDPWCYICNYYAACCRCQERRMMGTFTVPDGVYRIIDGIPYRISNLPHPLAPNTLRPFGDKDLEAKTTEMQA